MRRSERGEGKWGVIFFVAILAAAIFVALKWVPTRVNAAEFKEFVADLCLNDLDPRQRAAGPESVKTKMVEKAAELGFQLDPKAIDVIRSGEGMQINVTLEKDIDFKVYTYKFKLDCSGKSKAV
jgi:hypothetical protein